MEPFTVFLLPVGSVMINLQVYNKPQCSCFLPKCEPHFHSLGAVWGLLNLQVWFLNLKTQIMAEGTINIILVTHLII